MVKDDVIIKVTNDMAMVLTNYQLEKLKEALNSNLEKIEMSVITDEEEKQKEKNTNENYINMFISAKEVEGCSIRTIKYYREIIERMIDTLDKAIKSPKEDILSAPLALA